MNHRLPPLNTLRAFEATSRLLSAKAAAGELNVTPAAISHQIKQLESYLEIKLFKRLNRRLLLTEEGQRYSIFLQDLFKQLAIETKKILKKDTSYITLSVEPAFALYWLIPRIHKFRQAHPNIDLRISSTYEQVDFKSSDIDVAIHWGKGNYPNLFSTLLFRNEVFPICSPKILKAENPIREPNDLKHYTLLHETPVMAQPNYPVWKTWLNEVNAKEVDPESGLYFETGFLLMQAVIHGQGIALERSAFFECEIKAERLIRLFDFSIVEYCGGYYAVCPKDHLNNTKIELFLSWLNIQVNCK